MATYRIWPATNGPDEAVSDNAVNLGTQFTVSQPAWVTALRYYRGTTAVNPDELRLWRIESSSSATSLTTITPPAASTLGWQDVPLETPVRLTAGQDYKTAGHFPSDYVATGGYWASGPGANGITNGILTAPGTVASLYGQGTFRYGVGGLYPTGSFNGGNYWLDVVVVDVDPNPPADLFTISTTGTRTGWHAPTVRHGWTGQSTRTGWAAGRVIT